MKWKEENRTSSCRNKPGVFCGAIRRDRCSWMVEPKKRAIPGARIFRRVKNSVRVDGEVKSRIISEEHLQTRNGMVRGAENK